ncbi:DNA/RNA non-specific endonuclease [Lactobacillus sp. PV034]|uniref:DNA/RNA non-specific endonuclease n=1 Tax=Lactobacillus sp. PV034 TaxID=2594495 RepID=UPI00223F423B|nr:DNA/RNA non-specific endonuclease [Lactobacillus sp. PV034]QNQ80515.1 hypothetical protein FP432_02590 [Lactobacillus sp. PV034]
MDAIKKLIMEKFKLDINSEENSGINILGYFNLNTTQRELNKIINAVNINEPIKTFQNYEVIKRPISWIVYLTKNPINNEEILPNIKVYSFDIQNRNILNKGHLIAEKFQKYLITTPEKVKFFFKNNIRNIILQFSNINSSTDGYKGQSYFEAKIRNAVENDKNIYYEIKPKFFDEEDKIPAGCELIAFEKDSRIKDFNSNDNGEVPFHIFIPNVGNEEFWKNFEGKPNLRYSILNFYKTGIVE